MLKLDVLGLKQARIFYWFLLSHLKTSCHVGFSAFHIQFTSLIRANYFLVEIESCLMDYLFCTFHFVCIELFVISTRWAHTFLKRKLDWNLSIFLHAAASIDLLASEFSSFGFISGLFNAPWIEGVFTSPLFLFPFLNSSLILAHEVSPLAHLYIKNNRYITIKTDVVEHMK